MNRQRILAALEEPADETELMIDRLAELLGLELLQQKLNSGPR